MRTAVAVTTILITLLFVGLPRLAAGQVPERRDEVKGTSTGGGVQFTGSDVFEVRPRPGASSGAQNAGLAAPPPELVGSVLAAGTLADGTTCFGTRSQVFGTVGEAEQATDVTNALRLVPLGAACQAAPGAGVVAPELVALEFWKQADLPVPQPVIEPGWAITGKTAYLETNAAATAQFSWDIPGFGVLVVDADAALTVDWGDGGGVRSYSSVASGPWPDGGVTNVYGDAGMVDVLVTQDWTAQWSLGGASGTLGGLETSGVIDDFEVRQIQAVIG